MLPHFLHFNSVFPWYIILTSVKVISPLSLNIYRKLGLLLTLFWKAPALSCLSYGMASDLLLNPNVFITPRCKHLTTSSDEGVLSTDILKYMYLLLRIFYLFIILFEQSIDVSTLHVWTGHFLYQFHFRTRKGGLQNICYKKRALDVMCQEPLLYKASPLSHTVLPETSSSWNSGQGFWSQGARFLPSHAREANNTWSCHITTSQG